MSVIAPAILGCIFALAGLWIFRTGKIGIRPEVKLLIELIRAGKDWDRDDYKMWHPSGVCIWIANAAYGMGVKWGAGNRNDYVTKSSATNYRLNAFERQAIWNAVKRGGSADQKAIHLFAKRVEEMYAEPRP